MSGLITQETMGPEGLQMLSEKLKNKAPPFYLNPPLNDPFEK